MAESADAEALCPLDALAAASGTATIGTAAIGTAAIGTAAIGTATSGTATGGMAAIGAIEPGRSACMARRVIASADEIIGERSG